MTRRLCVHVGCIEPPHARTLCKHHYRILHYRATHGGRVKRQKRPRRPADKPQLATKIPPGWANFRTKKSADL